MGAFMQQVRSCTGGLLAWVRMVFVCVPMVITPPAWGQQNETKIETESVKKSPETRVGVVNIEQVLRNSLVWQDLLNRFEKRRAVLQQDIERRQSILEQQGKDLKAKETKMDADTFAQRRDDYFAQAQKLQQDATKTKGELDNYFLAGRQQVYAVLYDILATMANKRGLSLIMDESKVQGMVYITPDIRLDDDVLMALNKRIQAVSE